MFTKGNDWESIHVQSPIIHSLTTQEFAVTDQGFGAPKRNNPSESGILSLMEEKEKKLQGQLQNSSRISELEGFTSLLHVTKQHELWDFAFFIWVVYLLQVNTLCYRLTVCFCSGNCFSWKFLGDTRRT